jgi:hypothetical protein
MAPQSSPPLLPTTPPQSGTFSRPRQTPPPQSATPSSIPRKTSLPLPLPFESPPKQLKKVEQVLKDIPGTDMASLRLLAVALARDAIFGREEWARCKLTDRGGGMKADQKKLDYIKATVFARIPNKSKVELEFTWKLCRLSLSNQPRRYALKQKRNCTSFSFCPYCICSNYAHNY